MNESDIQMLYDGETIQNQVNSIGRQLEADLGAEDPLLISVIGGSVIFLADLIRSIQRPIRYEFIQVQYSAGAVDDQVMEIHYPISMDVSDQTLILVKDVVTTGVIETYLRHQFLQRQARKVIVAALLDLPEERRTDLRVDYRLFTPKKAGLFVGYGLKTGGRYGNLPYVGRLSEQDSGIGRGS